MVLSSQKGPHIFHEDSTRSMMLDTLIALAPAALWALYAHGLRAGVLICLSAILCAAFEGICNRVIKKKWDFGSLSPVVTGFLLAFLLPQNTPLYVLPLGAFLAIVIGKVLWGGLGKNPVNPALFAYTVLTLVMPRAVGRFAQPFSSLSPFAISFYEEELKDHLAPTPLSFLKEGRLPEDITFSQLFTGSYPTAIGTGAALLLLAGFVYLLVRGIASFHIPVSYLAGVAVLSLIFPLSFPGSRPDFMLTNLLSGSLILSATFMATDPVTSPITSWGKVAYGLLAAILTMVFRFATPLFDGVAPAILIASLFSRPLDFLFRPRVYGKKWDLPQRFLRGVKDAQRIVENLKQASKEKKKK